MPRHLLVLVAITAFFTVGGCAAPTPDEELGDSADAVTAASPPFSLYIPGSDLPAEDGRHVVQLMRVRPQTVTRIDGSLNLVVRVKRELADELVSCAGGFLTAGLSAEEIAAKDAELLRSCERPNARISGREGWSRSPGPGTVVTFRSNATPFLAEGQHVIVVFSAGGTTDGYVFEN